MKVSHCGMFIISRESAESLLDLDIFNLSADKNKKSGSLAGTAGTAARSGEEEDDEGEDNAPLFWQPGKRGYYSPRAGRNTPERLNAFRNVGRSVVTKMASLKKCALEHLVVFAVAYSMEITSIEKIPVRWFYGFSCKLSL